MYEPVLIQYFLTSHLSGEVSACVFVSEAIRKN